MIRGHVVQQPRCTPSSLSSPAEGLKCVHARHALRHSRHDQAWWAGCTARRAACAGHGGSHQGVGAHERPGAAAGDCHGPPGELPLPSPAARQGHLTAYPPKTFEGQDWHQSWGRHQHKAAVAATAQPHACWQRHVGFTGTVALQSVRVHEVHTIPTRPCHSLMTQLLLSYRCMPCEHIGPWRPIKYCTRHPGCAVLGRHHGCVRAAQGQLAAALEVLHRPRQAEAGKR